MVTGTYFRSNLILRKIEQAYFEELKFHDLAKKICLKELNFKKIDQILVCINSESQNWHNFSFSTVLNSFQWHWTTQYNKTKLRIVWHYCSFVTM